MPKRPAHIRKYTENLLHSVKRLSEKTSPRKKRQKIEDSESNKENVSCWQQRLDSELFSHLHTLKMQHYSGTVVVTKEKSPSKFASGPLFHNFSLTTCPESPMEVPKVRTSQFLARSDCAMVEDVVNNGSLVHDHAGETVTGESCGDRSDSEPAGQRVPRAPTSPTSEYSEPTCDGKLREAPTVELAALALADLKKMLQGNSRGKGGGYKDPNINPFVQHKLEAMHTFLYSYTNPNSLTYRHWADASMQTAIGVGHGRFCSRTLRALTRQYINDRELLPINPYGDWNESMLADEALALEIGIHLQELRDDITAKKLVEYLAHPDVMVRHGITRVISIRTARRHLKAVGY
jgi:hypothetical protein